MIEHTKLSSYKMKKGVLVSPWNEFMSAVEDAKSWSYGRMPEYIWIGLILLRHGRKEGIKRLAPILNKINSVSGISQIRISDLICIPEEQQREIYASIIDNAGIEALSPLTVIVSADVNEIFSGCFATEETIEKRAERLVQCARKVMDQHSETATDIRYVVLFYSCLVGKMHLMEDQYKMLLEYQFLNHNDEKMKLIRPMIRSTEMMILTMEPPNIDYLNLFWSRVSELTECELFMVKYPEESNDTGKYVSLVKELFGYLHNLLVTCMPLDIKAKVIIGISTYSYRRLEEAEKHHLYNSIAGRSVVRVLIENYIMLKYLLLKEQEKDNVWKEYEEYGIGQYKLVLSRYREDDDKRDSHVDFKMLEILVNEYKNEEFLNMDTKYFMQDNMRTKAELVDEKKLYSLYYDYDSAFEHGLWGAIRESSMHKCNNPAHQYHCVPTVDEIILKSVFPDSVYVMNKTLSLLNNLYGLPELMLKEVMDFEQSIV